jgi:glycosyltransferase involved in cell wall biosynthesis
MIRHRPLLSATLFFRPEYGFDLAVAAIARMRAKYPGVGCVVMGSGEDRARAERQIRDAAIADSVLLLGDVDHTTCLAVMARSDVFIRPTLCDGDSISVREALALGTPVVASRTGTRPAGANLFSTGNLDELLWSIDTALASEAQQTADAIPAGCMNRLIEIYGQVVNEVTFAAA